MGHFKGEIGNAHDNVTWPGGTWSSKTTHLESATQICLFTI